MALTDKPKPRVKKYPPDFGKLNKTDEKVLSRAAYIGVKHGLNDVTFDRFMTKIRHDILMERLLIHYKIELDDADCWKKLAYELALNHVPAFSSSGTPKVGRPRTKTKFRNMLAGPKKRGAPVDKERKEWLESLLNRVVLIANREGLHGKGAITGALVVLIKAVATSEKKSFMREKGTLLPKLQKAVSEAKKLFPAIAAKLPK